MSRSCLYKLVVEELERRYLQAKLEENRWNRTQTAREVGLSYRTLLWRIERLGLTPPPQEFSQTA